MDFGAPWGAPYRGLKHVVTGPQPRSDTHWEDPFIWQDMQGHWHILAHVYNLLPCGDGDPSKVTAACNYTSGHIFSRDGLTNWNMADAEPYSLKIDNDGSAGLVATRERPKLLFDEITSEPTRIYTAAAALPKDACARCTHSGPAHQCLH